MSRDTITIRVSQEFIDMLYEAGGERSGALVALAIIGARQIGIPIGLLGTDVGLALASPLREEPRKGLLDAYHGTQSQSEDAPLSPAPLMRRASEPPPGDEDLGNPLEFNC